LLALTDVFSAFATDCGYKTDVCYDHALTIFNPITKMEQTLDLNFAVIESNFDVIIGYNAIRRYDLTTNYAYLFTETKRDTVAMNPQSSLGSVGVGIGVGRSNHHINTPRTADTPNLAQNEINSMHISLFPPYVTGRQ